MKLVKLTDICTPKQWKTIVQKELSDTGKYPVYGANGIIGYYDKFNHKDETILIACRGTCGTINLSMPFSYVTGNAMCLDNLDETICTKKYLYYYLKNYDMKKIITGTSQPQITVQSLDKVYIRMYNKDIQNKITNILDKVQNIIDIKKEQIYCLDRLIRAKFIEMFDRPNRKAHNYREMTEVCEIIDGDRGKNYPKAEEFFKDEYCLFLNAKNVTNAGFSFQNCMYITKEKDEKLRNGKLKRGDIVLTTRGTVGNLAFYTEDVPFENIRINSGMVILRIKKNLLNEIFFIEQFKMQLDNIKSTIANGSAQPQLPIAKMNGIKILIPNIKLQNEFADIVKQINKKKTEIEASLNTMEELMNSLCNKFFTN